MQRIPHIFERAELIQRRRAIYDAARADFVRWRNLLAFDIMRTTGNRPGVVLSIRDEDIDYSRGIWTSDAHREKTRRNKVFYLGANRALWRFLLWYRERFAAQIERDGWLFPSRKGRRNYPARHFTFYVWRGGKATGRGGGWGRGCLYDVRATRFTTLFRRGHSLGDILQLSQHQDVNVLYRFYVLAQQEATQSRLLAEP